jgi:hypothetical protein
VRVSRRHLRPLLAAATTSTPVNPVGTIKAIMKGIVDPSSAAIWDAVSTESGPKETSKRRQRPTRSGVGEEIDNACESCHKVYWYPDEKIPNVPAGTPPASKS